MRLNAEEMLNTSEERYRMFVEILPDGVVVTVDGDIIFINKAGLSLLTEIESAEDVIGKSFKEFLHPLYHTAADKVLKNVG